MARKVETGIILTASAKGFKKGLDGAGKGLKGLRKGLELTGKGVESFGSSYRAGIDVIFKSVEVFKSVQGLLQDTVGKFLEASREFRLKGIDPQIKAIDKFKREAHRTLGAFGDIFTAMYAGIADALGPAVKNLRAFIKQNKELIGTKIIEFLAETANTLLNVLGPAINYSYKIFSGFKMIVSLTSAAFAKFRSGVSQVELAFRMLGESQALDRVKEKQEAIAESQRKIEKTTRAGNTAFANAEKKRLEVHRQELKELQHEAKLAEQARADAQSASNKAARESAEAQAAATREILQQEKNVKQLEEVIKKVQDSMGKGIAKAAAAAQKRLQETVITTDKTQDEQQKAIDERNKKREEAIKRAVELDRKRHEERMRRLEAEKALQAQIGATIGSSVGGAIKDVISGTKSASEAMRDFAISVAQAIVKATILATVQAAVKAGTMSAFGGGVISGVAGGLLSFNTGGYVPGFASGGGVDSVMARLTPGEYVLPKGLVDSIRLGKAPPKAAYNAGGMVNAGAQLPAGGGVNIQMQTFAVPTRGQFRRWYKSSVAPNVQSLKRRGQV